MPGLTKWEVRKANERIATATALRELRVASVVEERRLQHLADAEKKDHNYTVAPLTVVQQEHDAQKVRQEERDVDHMTKQ